MDGKQSMKTPLYQAVVDELMEQIRAGAFSFDEPLCTEARLMEKHGISRITARRALDELESKGLIYRKRGIGCFVSRTAYENMNETATGELTAEPQSKLYAFVFPFELSRTGLSDAFTAANQYLMENGCFAAIYITKNEVESRGRTVLTKLLNMNVAGVAYYPSTGSYHLSFLDKLLFQRKSVVVLDVESHCPYISSVTSDNLGGSLLLMEHLTKLGHRRIAYVSGVLPEMRSTVCDRYAGYLLGHEKAGLTINPEFITTDLPDHIRSPQQSAAMLRELLDGYMQAGVTAILAENDAVAHNILTICREMGIRVPEDMSVCGFDGNEWAHALEHAEQPLTITTIEQDQAAMGREAARLLLENTGRPIHVANNVRLPVKLVVGTSTAAPRTHTTD